MNRTNRNGSGHRIENALDLAVRLAVRQLSDGIGIDEAIQFAAKYHNVTCTAVEIELHKLGHRSSPRRILKAATLPKVR